jgi:hypothetical protein
MIRSVASIGSTSQRESPSGCYGISTPGRAIYLGGIGGGAGGDAGITNQELQAAQPSAVNVIARRGGHTLVMDDGDLNGNDNLIRIRTSKGHQITMSDDGNCLYICHANGQSWIELGQEGTMDVYTTNSVNSTHTRHHKSACRRRYQHVCRREDQHEKHQRHYHAK